MPPFAVILPNLIVAALLAAAATGSTRLRSASPRGHALTGALLAALLLLDGILLAAFVFGEDDYRGNGISRWDAYRSPSGGALGPMFVISLVLLGVAAALVAFAGAFRRTSLLAATALGSAAACTVLVTATVIGFSAN